MNVRAMRVVVVSTTLALGGCAADGSDSDEDDGIASSNAPAVVGEEAVSGGQAGAGFYEVPSLASLLAAEQAMLDDAQIGRGRRKTTCNTPSNYSSDVTIAETNMGNWVDDIWQICNSNGCVPVQGCNRNQAFCPEGTIAGSFALKSLSDQGGGDDLAVTGVALGCYNPASGQFVQWAIPENQATSGAWDVSSPCNLGTRIRGGNFVLLAGPSSFDDTGVSDGAISCTNGTTLDVAVNNPSWGSWQGWRNCPSGKVACGIQQKFDPDNGSDDASVAGIRFKCCNN
jgi:hypothetical protein